MRVREARTESSSPTFCGPACSLSLPLAFADLRVAGVGTGLDELGFARDRTGLFWFADLRGRGGGRVMTTSTRMRFAGRA